MILEIESYLGDTILYGKRISEFELKRQLNEIETSYDDNEDNFLELLCRRFGWNVLENAKKPDFIYDRDIKRLVKC